MIDWSDFTNLAPMDVKSRRQTRFDGSGFELNLSEFGATDQERILLLYSVVKQVYQAWLDSGKASPETLEQWPSMLHALTSPESVSAVTMLGENSEYDQARRQVIHDLRGGGLSAAMGFAQLALIGNTKNPLRIVYYARDHAKIMRNLIADLDPDVRLSDESERAHDLKGLLVSWRDGEHRLGDHSVAVDVMADYQGNVSCCCLEISSLSRVVYNLINNAARFAADDKTAIMTRLVSPDIVRIVVANRLTEAQLEWTREHTVGSLQKLFLGGITSGGQGIGLSNCTDIVGSSFGYTDRASTLQADVIGAKLVGDVFCVYFHWPTF